MTTMAARTVMAVATVATVAMVALALVEHLIKIPMVVELGEKMEEMTKGL
jgi:hypothetical protein